MLVTLKGQTVKDKRKASVHVCFPNRSTSSYHILRLKKGQPLSRHSSFWHSKRDDLLHF